MKQFARLIAEVSQTSGADRQVEAMVRFLSVVGEEEKLWMIALFCQKRPARRLVS